MKVGLKIGAKGVLSGTVSARQTIQLGAGQLRSVVVFSTPSMIDLMEHAAREALHPFLDDGEESVGSVVHVEHLAATPIGAVVRAEATVTAIDGKQIDFEIAAFDEAGPIGKGLHRRAIIQTDRFATRLSDKTSKLPGGVVLPIHITPNVGDLPELNTIQVRRDGALVTVTLNRPQKLNAVNRQMTSDWEQVNAWLAGHPEMRVVIVTGAGDAFCAGDDVKEVGTLPIDEATELSHRQAAMYLAWERLPQIFIAAVNGMALGAGCVAAYSCDFRLAAHSARFGMPEILLGWPPGYGLAQLTALVGKARALDLCLTGKQITAKQAAEYGLVHEVMQLSLLSDAARELAQNLLAKPAEALRETKRLIHEDEGSQAKIAHLADTASYIRCLQLPDAREGIAAFTEKRIPKFEG